MKKISIVIFLFFFVFNIVHAQKQSWDIFSYMRPKGYKLKQNTSFILLEKNEGREYCQLFLYPATSGTGNGEADFKNVWNYFARNPSQNVTEPETTEKDTAAAWHNYFGAARGMYNKKPFVVSVSSYTMKDITFYAAAVFTAQNYLQEVKTFIESIEPNALKFVRKTNQPPVNNSPSANTPPVNSSVAKSSKRITQSTTVFNDGWTSNASDDYVSITNQNTEARLIFPDASIEKNQPQNTSIFEPHYWDNVVRRYYEITGQVIVREKPMYSYSEYDIWMAPASDIKTGKQGWLAMQLSFKNGVSTVITIFAPGKEYLDVHFNKTADFVRMFGYNKFNATTADITGEWKNSTGSGIEYYNVYTGNSAGMATAHVSDQFIFNSNGTYQSEHTGTSTFLGAVSHGKSNYNGTYQLKDGTLTITGRGADDLGEFICYFEAVKMGFLLRLINKKYAGMNMSLYRTK